MLRPRRPGQPARRRRGGAPLSEARRTRIEQKLRERLAAVRVEVIDESHLHAGHAGAASGAGHFAATVVSERFRGLARVAAQRLVYEALADEMGPEIHALRIRTLLPESDESPSPDQPGR